MAKGLFVTPTNYVGIDHLGREFGKHLAHAEVSMIVKESIGAVPAHGVTADIMGSLTALVNELTISEFRPSVILVPFDYPLLRTLGLRGFGNAERTQFGLNLAGDISGIPVVQWFDVPKNRILIADLARLVRISEAVDTIGNPVEPITDVQSIDTSAVARIVASWGPDENEPDDETRVRKAMTNVRLYIRRPYRIELLDRSAGRVLELEPPDEAGILAA